MRVTKQYITDHIEVNYGDFKHGHEAGIMLKASQTLAKKYKTKTEHIFHFVIENQDIPNLIVNSYGFNTELGRAIKDDFKATYYSIKEKREDAKNR